MAERGAPEAGEGARPLECELCGARFKTAAGADRHSCARKRIMAEAGSVSLARAFEAFDFWYRYNGFAKRKGKGYQEFLTSPYFKLFVELDRASTEVDIGPVREYLKWLSDRRVPSSDWCMSETVMRYRIDSVKSADAEAQAMRSLESIAAWCDSKGIDISEFFTRISPGEATQWVQVGRLSPWILVASDRMWELVSRMTDEQLAYFTGAFDVEYWAARAKVAPERAEAVRQMVAQVGL